MRTCAARACGRSAPSSGARSTSTTGDHSTRTGELWPSGPRESRPPGARNARAIYARRDQGGAYRPAPAAPSAFGLHRGPQSGRQLRFPVCIPQRPAGRWSRVHANRALGGARNVRGMCAYLCQARPGRPAPAHRPLLGFPGRSSRPAGLSSRLPGRGAARPGHVCPRQAILWPGAPVRYPHLPHRWASGAAGGAGPGGGPGSGVLAGTGRAGRDLRRRGGRVRARVRWPGTQPQ